MSTFLQVADYYLVAHAHAHQFTVVTHEVAAQTTKKIKIPNACIDLGVKVMSPYEMLRVEKARFVLGGTTYANTQTGGSGAANPEAGQEEFVERPVRSSVVHSVLVGSTDHISAQPLLGFDR